MAGKAFLLRTFQVKIYLKDSLRTHVMRRSSALIYSAALISILFLAVSLTAVLPLAAQTAAPTPRGHMHMRHKMPRPTNLQVLPKNISDKQLMTIMHGFKSALGVECSFCHAESPATHHLDFASDAKPDKNIARTMIRMTEEINAKYLSTVHDPDATPAEKKVTCGTCHRGHSMPEPFVAKNTGEGHPPMPPKS